MNKILDYLKVPFTFGESSKKFFDTNSQSDIIGLILFLLYSLTQVFIVPDPVVAYESFLLIIPALFLLVIFYYVVGFSFRLSGKMFKVNISQKDFRAINVFSSATPFLLLFFLLFPLEFLGDVGGIEIIASILSFLAIVWSLIVFVNSVMKVGNVSALRSVTMIIIGTIILVIFVMIILTVFLAAFAGSFLAFFPEIFIIE